ncbi:MBL fold metallo-hydrolase [Sulfobacillus harzensis]|uniref:MBL fold metallo-hydrolase n=1 Tax=Sulfobacillus harzensis TaxID=2729629 RepID=A0A7Y0L318_9FIRM|nr:MBL fold metallo-hydrolase [Sulfobacillus harzensis]NMP22388.1 MBL fold metallo-hydrolase [Sulfobacillus harzensis]
MSNSHVATIIEIPIPVPLPVKYTNCYAIDTGSGWVIVDAGMDTPDARNAWADAIAKHQLDRGKTALIVITHCHPDHVGLAAWLSQQLECPVAMMAGDADTAERYLNPGAQHEDIVHRFYGRHGVPSLLVNSWLRLDDLLRQTLVLPESFQRLHDGETTTIGSTTLTFIEQGGHTDHQGVLYLPEARTLFTGDQVLARITPNVSLWPEADPNPLQRYLHSLSQLKTLGPVIGLAAHEQRIADVRARIQELEKHHEKRSAQILALLESGSQNAFELTPRLFSRRPLDDYQLRFAIGETLAHLEYLTGQGLVLAVERNGLIHYQRRDA